MLPMVRKPFNNLRYQPCTNKTLPFTKSGRLVFPPKSKVATSNPTPWHLWQPVPSSRGQLHPGVSLAMANVGPTMPGPGGAMRLPHVESLLVLDVATVYLGPFTRPAPGKWSRRWIPGTSLGLPPTRSEGSLVAAKYTWKTSTYQQVVRKKTKQKHRRSTRTGNQIGC